MVKESASRTVERVLDDNTLEKKVCFIVAVCVAIALAVVLFCSSDFKPATFDEYVPLNDKLVSAQNNPMSMLNGDGTITIKNGVVNYTVSNDQCEMTGTYDSEFNLVGKSQKDKAVTVIFALFVCVLFIIFMSLIIYFATLIVVYLAMFIIFLIKKAIENKKAKQPKEAAVPQDEVIVDEVLDGQEDEVTEEDQENDFADEEDANQDDPEDEVPGENDGVQQTSVFEQVVEEARKDNS